MDESNFFLYKLYRCLQLGIVYISAKTCTKFLFKKSNFYSITYIFHYLHKYSIDSHFLTDLNTFVADLEIFPTSDSQVLFKTIFHVVTIPVDKQMH